LNNEIVTGKKIKNDKLEITEYIIVCSDGAVVRKSFNSYKEA
jgi:hypothetical protein